VLLNVTGHAVNKLY